jgi:phosphoglycerate dehydrogenase-like enzyme
MQDRRLTRVLMTDRAATSVASALGALPVTPVLLSGDVGELDVAWLSGDVFQDQELLQRFYTTVSASPGLRWLHSNAAAVDHPVLIELGRRGVALSTANVTGPPIAEYVIRGVLDWFQRAGEWRSTIAEGQWAKHEFREVLGTTWLVIGMGSIGREIASRARAFGAHVIGVRRSPRGDEPVDEILTADRVHDSLPRADVVVLALPASSATAGMVDDGFLGRMRSGSVLVNVARGTLVDEVALIAALDRGTPEAALLDVTATEPLPAESPLWTHARVVLTPHSSALGINRHARAQAVFLENLARFLGGEPLVNAVEGESLGLQA